MVCRAIMLLRTRFAILQEIPAFSERQSVCVPIPCPPMHNYLLRHGDKQTYMKLAPEQHLAYLRENGVIGENDTV